MGRRDQDVHFLASKEEVQRIHEKMDEARYPEHGGIS